VLLTNIPHVSHAARAAGAIWVSVEGIIASCQASWKQVAKNRCLYLLGSADPGAPRSLGVLLALAFLFVGMLNVPLLLPHTVDALSHLMSNDDEVFAVFRQLVWVLVVHSQTRIVDQICGSILVPIGWPRLGVLITFVSFWLVAAPIAIVAALTDMLATTLLARVAFCVACTSIAQGLNALCYGILLLRLDWAAAAQFVIMHANTDRGVAPLVQSGADGGAEEEEVMVNLVSDDPPPSVRVPNGPPRGSIDEVIK